LGEGGDVVSFVDEEVVWSGRVGGEGRVCGGVFIR
jgi:hypothetical protein